MKQKTHQESFYLSPYGHLCGMYPHQALSSLVMSFHMVHADVALGRVNAAPVIHQEMQHQLWVHYLGSVLPCATPPRHDKRGILAEHGSLRRDPADEQPNVLDNSGRNTHFYFTISVSVLLV